MNKSYTIVFVTLLLLITVNTEESDCSSTRIIDEYWYETYDFSGFIGQKLSIAAESGLSFGLDFCNNAFGSIKIDAFSYGWNFGYFTNFTVDIKPDANYRSLRQEHLAYKFFEQTYKNGDKGIPCEDTGRSAEVDIYCIEADKFNCYGVPNAKNSCLADGGASLDYCICSFSFDDNSPCDSLKLNILSKSCPDAKAHNPVGPHNPNYVLGEFFAIFGLSIFIIVVVAFLFGFLFNVTVNEKRGFDAVPFVNFCSKQDTHLSVQSKADYGTLDA
eukprot:TRINITY_DN9004_c0_g1_i1.p1 TRINITY_DN9004_c0_g1~~TRINITY_DN9004_c0_g1_i1.p1  ORF type:complete len:273 (-),score=54.23 TRINITY_DN9004_c0_g1_i1:17-835(-)